MPKDTKEKATVQVWVEPEIKRRAEAALSAIGLTPSDAVTLLYKCLATDEDLPPELHIPNDETLRVMEDAKKGVRVETYESLNDLRAEFRRM